MGVIAAWLTSMPPITGKPDLSMCIEPANDTYSYSIYTIICVDMLLLFQIQ